MFGKDHFYLAGAFALTASQQQIAADSHNNYRSQLAKGQALDNNNSSLPQGKNIYQLIYNLTVENSAQQWANNCEWKHSGPGECMFATSAQISNELALQQASDSWWSELAQYGVNHDLNLTTAEFNKGIGHWSQMAWAKSTQLGCGVTWCPNGAPPITWPSALLVVCQYRQEVGNILNQLIYEAGIPCTKDADCTTLANSYCNAALGLCSTVPIASLPNTTATSTVSAGPATTTAEPALTTLATSPNALSPAQQQIAVDIQNNFRSQLAQGKALDNNNATMPQGKNIYLLKYGPTEGASAQKWADNCTFQFTGRFGENLFGSSAQLTPEQAVQTALNTWWSQLAQKGMNHNLNLTQDVVSGIESWAQMAWGKTSLIGCGVNWCPNGAPPITYPATIVACHYTVIGVYLNQFIYEAGSPCTKDADCTTYANSVCNATLGLCST